MRYPENRDIIKQSEKILTNYFTGNMDKQLRTALGDKFQFKITNQLQSSAIRVAIATGNVNTLGVDTVSNKAVLHHHDVAGLVREGHPVDTILDDSTVSVTVNGETGTVAMSTLDSSRSISHTRNHLRLNPRWIKKITISASSTNVYQSSMVIATLSPFKQTPEEVIDLNQYYRVDQYQNDKIEMEFAREQLQWNDDLFMAINLPGGSWAQMTIEFYD